MKVMVSRYKYYVLMFIILIGVGVGAYFVGYQNAVPVTRAQVEQEKADFVRLSPLLINTTAVMNGIALTNDGKTVTISANGKNDTFIFADGASIFEPDENNQNIMVNSHHLMDLQLHKKAIFNLKVINNQFEIVSVAYTAESTSSATRLPVYKPGATVNPLSNVIPKGGIKR